MSTIPTDLHILDAIHDRYYDEFKSFDKNTKTRSLKIHVPIDIQSIADDLSIDGDIIFGRLYYDLEQRYGYKNDDGSRVCFFSLEVGGERHAINFPYAASILARLRDENKKYRTAIVIAIISLFVAFVSLAISLAR